jgi:lipopolysaccharide biosynthesis glycosyltransferase
MNILFAINEAFVPGLLTAVASLCVNNPGCHTIYVMHDGLSEKATQKINKLSRRFGCTIHFVNIHQGVFSDSLYSSLPRYYAQSINRLLPQLAVPNDVDRLLYLDADLVVNGSIQEFYDTDFSGQYLAAPSIRKDGQDGGPYWDSETMVYGSIKIPLRPETLYFNSGVLLMNVQKFREISESFYRPIVEKYHDQIVFADQDILNLAFEGKTINIIDRRLNCTVAENVRIRKGEYKWAKQNVKVLHFVVNPKPWKFAHYRPVYFLIYLKYYRLVKPEDWAWAFIVWLMAKPFHLAGKIYRKIRR